MLRCCDEASQESMVFASSLASVCSGLAYIFSFAMQKRTVLRARNRIVYFATAYKNGGVGAILDSDIKGA